MVTDSIPSIHTQVRLASGALAQIYAIHPTPPMPQENPLSTDRDAELMMTSELSRNSKLPVIVIGDFNDVPWSSTTQLFQATSELLDVRIGRGIYSTFNANHRFLRWPLDHIFASAEFRVAYLEVGNSIDSDHFPYYAELTFEPKGAKEQQPTKATKEQLEKAKKQLEKFKTKQNM